MTAYPFEYEFAKQDGVEFRWLVAPKRFIGDDNGHVKQIECVRMALRKSETNRRARPVEIEGSEFLLAVDIVVTSIVQKLHYPLIEEFNLDHDDCVVIVDQNTYLTSTS